MALQSMQYSADLPEFIPDKVKAEEMEGEVKKEEKKKEPTEPVEEEVQVETGDHDNMMLLCDYQDIILPRRDTYAMIVEGLGPEAKPEQIDEAAKMVTLLP
jgi:hypothetical protein